MNKVFCWILLSALSLSAVAADVKPRTLELIRGKQIEIALDFVPEIQTGGSDAVTVKYIPSKKKLVVSALSYGTERVVLRDAATVRDILDIQVRPVNWTLFRKILQDAPNIRFDVGEGKLLLSGKCGGSATVERIRRIMALAGTKGEVVNNTELDTERILADAQEFIRRQNFENISLRLLNRTVFASGEVYDAARRTQLTGLLTEYFRQFDCTVNSSALSITSRKIAMRIVFLDVDKNKLRQLGIKVDSPVKWNWAFGEIMKYFSIGETRGLKVDGFSGTIDILQQNNLAKVVYEVRLSTLSGEKAAFQQGGVLNVRIYSQYNTDLKEIEYGFQVNATPYTLNANTIGLDFDMQLTRPKNENSWTRSDEDKDVAQYMTKSKYTMDAGSTMVISSFGHNEYSDKQAGLPWFSEIPVVGSWLFGSTSTGGTDREIILLLNVDWEDRLKEENAEALKRSGDEVKKIRKRSQDTANTLRNAKE